MRILPILVLSLFFIISTTSPGQTRFERSQKTTLFESETPLEITLEMDLDKVTNDLKDRADHPATLTVMDNGEKKSFQIKVKTRGKTRANPIVCQFPPLEVNFKKKGTVGSVFDGQDKLKLVTHCSERNTAVRYVTQEYLTYKQFNVLTDYSFKVRLLKIKYVDTSGSNDDYESIGFFIEDQDVLAQRNNMIRFKLRVFNQDQCVEESIDLFTVFQFMIGNTDWSVKTGHNVKVISDANAMIPVPIPYDFDYSGIINTHYAVPAPGLGIESVRTRIFRGLCREPGKYEKIFEHFNNKREELFNVYTESGHLTAKEQKGAISYMESFYKIINDPKKSRNQLIRACRIGSHEHKY